MSNEIHTRIFCPVAVQLIDFCSAVFWVGGAFQNADEMVKTGIKKDKRTYHHLSKISKMK
jgi:RNA:NAD 2'-phosphotransferase (TPT1/KptA family)